jgi:hypothetical protein
LALHIISNPGIDTNITGEEVDAEKHDLLRKQKEGKGHWKEELASNSESIVRLPFRHRRIYRSCPEYLLTLLAG